jgi:hypothetical protein
MLRSGMYLTYEDAGDLVGAAERTGVLPPLGPGSFCGFTRRPGRVRGEFSSAGLDVADLVSVEGAAYLLSDLDARMEDERDWRVVLESARALERVPELMGGRLASDRHRPPRPTVAAASAGRRPVVQYRRTRIA